MGGWWFACEVVGELGVSKWCAEVRRGRGGQLYYLGWEVVAVTREAASGSS